MKNTNTVRTEIHYAQVEEYQLPLLTLPQTDDTELLGKYGRMRLAYLKNQRPVLYNRMLLNGFFAPGMRRKPAHCSKALAPMRGTFISSLRELKAPFSARKLTMFCASCGPRPEMYVSR